LVNVILFNPDNLRPIKNPSLLSQAVMGDVGAESALEKTGAVTVL